MMKTKTFEEEARQWVLHIESVSQKVGFADTEYLSKLRDESQMLLFGVGLSPTSLLWTEIARQAVNELGQLGRWDAEEMVSLLVSKRHDYGAENMNRFGLKGLLVRLSDKIERLKNLHSMDFDPIYEPIQETLFDVVGYSVLALILNSETEMA